LASSVGEIKPVKLIGKDSFYDVALLKIEDNKKYSFLKLADSDNLNLGERVFAVGNPLGLSFSITEGIVSGIERDPKDENKPFYIQTDAALNPGNSGGPLVNLDGLVIGVNNFRMKGENIGFALESNYVLKAIQNILSEAKIKPINW
jgi:serine protease Do